MRKNKRIHLPRELFMYVSQNVSRETIPSNVKILDNENKLFIGTNPEIREAFNLREFIEFTGYL